MLSKLSCFLPSSSNAQHRCRDRPVSGKRNFEATPVRNAVAQLPPEKRLRKTGGAVSAKRKLCASFPDKESEQLRKKMRAATQRDVAALVGDASESREAHLRRHGGGRADCPRCVWYRDGPSWVLAYGSVAQTRGRAREKVVWIAERPARWGGAWGLGCVFCAKFMLSLDSETCELSTSTKQRHRARIGTSWARYESRPASLQASHIKQHQHSDGHKLGTHVFFHPDEPLRLLMQSTDADDELLAGAVPQPADWLRCWRALKNPQSWQAAASAAQTEHFIHQIRAKAVLPRALESQALVMRECLRRKKRAWVASATYLSIGFDDKANHRLVYCKVDADYVEGLCGPMVANGGRVFIIGAYKFGEDMELDEFDDDAAIKIANSLIQCIKAFCTPYCCVFDETLYKQMLSKWTFFFADGCPCLVRVYHFLKSDHAPHLILRSRDPAHAVRIAIRDPIQNTGAFEEQHRRLFKSKHAVLKGVQHSDVMRSRLMACQKVVLREDGHQGGDLTHILRHISFIEPRFESEAGPRRKYVCTYVAFAMMLAQVAADGRMAKEKRDAAEAALEAMGGKDCVGAGLASDFADEGIAFLRQFDVHDHDPAKTFEEVMEFKRIFHLLFVQGYILCTPGETVEGLGDAKTLTQIAVEQCSEACEIHYGKKSKTLWSKTSLSDVKSLMRDIQSAAQDVLDRLTADFHLGEMHMVFRIFSLNTWKKIRRLLKGQGREEAELQMQSMLLGAKALAKALKVDFDKEEWKIACNAAYKCGKRMSEKVGMPVDHRIVWQALMTPRYKKDFYPGQDLPNVSRCVKAYQAYADGTPSIERGLARLAEIVQQHVGGYEPAGAGSSLSEACLEMLAESPEKESDLFVQEASGILLLTDTSRDYASVWIAAHGRRFACQKPRQKLTDNTEAKPTGWRLKGSDKSICIRRRAATQALVKKEGQNLLTIFGDSRERLMRQVADMPVSQDPSKKIQTFRKVTADRLRMKEATPFWNGHVPVKTLRLGGGAIASNAMGESSQIADSALKRARHLTWKQGMAANTKSPVLKKRQGDALAVAQSQESGGLAYVFIPRKRMVDAAVLIVPRFDDLVKKDLDSSVLRTWLVIVAYGKDVQESGTTNRMSFLPSMRLFVVTLLLSAGFVAKHGQLRSDIEMVSKASGSKWKLCIESQGDDIGGAKYTRISDLKDFRVFLLSARRYPQQRVHRGRYGGSMN